MTIEVKDAELIAVLTRIAEAVEAFKSWAQVEEELKREVEQPDRAEPVEPVVAPVVEAKAATKEPEITFEVLLDLGRKLQAAGKPAGAVIANRGLKSLREVKPEDYEALYAELKALLEEE